ncbi:4286_t:CDS:1 [Ambispora gerdemannii]|uniref:4286_t:CDS:1 n=1 Tax=Ambispora gerdemannii TaxID=144530 RepID=A0A9N8VAC4_9GLOM|nr:4286_t:CDS:1 [Ambispora gerdemannii]
MIITFVPPEDSTCQLSDVQIVRRYIDRPSLKYFRYLKRRCNGFILFRISVSNALKKGGRVRNARQISQLASTMWERMNSREKRRYENLSVTLSRENIEWTNQNAPITVHEAPNMTSIDNPNTEFYGYSRNIWRDEDAVLFEL